MAGDPLAFPSTTQLILSDPVLLTGMVLPFLLIIGIAIYRLRAWRRVTAMAARNEQRFSEAREQSSAMWQENAARQERMIGLLTEIRDHLARLDGPSGDPAGQGGTPR